MKLYCPFRETSIACLKPPVKIGEDNPPFSYTPIDAIKKLVDHIKSVHSTDEIFVFFEEYLAQEYLDLKGGSLI